MRLILQILGVLVALLVVLCVAVAVISTVKMNRTYTLPQADLVLTIPGDAASIARGHHIASAISGCAECHAANLGGSMMADVPPFRLVAPNLTRGRGGVGATFTDTDFVRAIRYGVGPDGRALYVMPSDAFWHFSDADLADLIAYVKSVPPVDNQLPDSDVKPLGRALLVAGQFPPMPADLVDRTLRPPVRTPVIATAEYGRYLANVAGCTSCHGAGLSGKALHGGPPSQNLTPTGIGQWSDADFMHAIRTGTRPDGTHLDTAMPWPVYSQMTNTELTALLKYLRSVPSRPTGTD
jgi:mono/diheme cytochrome c family protein